MRAVGNKKIAIHLHAGIAQHANFLQESQRIKHHAIANHGAAALAQHAARNQLENEFLALNNDRVAGVVSSGVARHHRKILGEDVDDLAFAFIAPLGAHNYGGLCVFHSLAHSSPVVDLFWFWNNLENWTEKLLLLINFSKQ